jgi:hypothetical protein
MSSDFDHRENRLASPQALACMAGAGLGAIRYPIREFNTDLLPVPLHQQACVASQCLDRGKLASDIEQTLCIVPPQLSAGRSSSGSQDGPVPGARRAQRPNPMFNFHGSQHLPRQLWLAERSHPDDDIQMLVDRPKLPPATGRLDIATPSGAAEEREVNRCRPQTTLSVASGIFRE